MWMGLALLVESRLWIAGVVQQSRDRSLADRLLRQVRACAHSVSQVLVCVDGWAAYPKAIVRAFRERVKTTAGKGRCSLQVWPHLLIGQVIKKQRKRRTVEVKRTLLPGEESAALACLHDSGGGKEINTSFIERFNATMRERLAALTRRCRHASQRLEAVQWGMYLIGCTDNLCWVHQPLGRTPAMAARLTDHAWSVKEVLCYKVAPAPFVPSKQPRRHPPTQPQVDGSAVKASRGRPSKYLSILRRLQEEKRAALLQDARSTNWDR
jgi:IS1 family transposase